METDFDSTLQELKLQVLQFVDKRGWTREHSPKNLAMSIAIEAAELMEHFQWASLEDAMLERLTDAQVEDIRLEVADVLIYLLSFARALNIDLTKAVRDKMAINELRFPIAVEAVE